MGIIAPLMSFYAESLNATGLWLGLIFGSFSISRGLLMPYIGRWSDIRERKDFMLAGLALYTLSSIGYAWTESIGALFWVRFVHGAASAAVVPIAFAYVGEITPRGQEGRYMGLFTTSMFLGMGLGPLTGGIIHDFFGMNYVFYSMGLLSLFSFVFILLLLPRTKKSEGRKMKTTSFGEMLKDSVVMGNFVFRITSSLGMGAIMVFLPLLAESKYGASTSLVGLMLSANILTSALLQSITGSAADRYNKMLMIYLGTLLSGTALILMPLSPNFYILFALGLLMGLGNAIYMPPSMALITISGKIHGMGAVMGLINTAMSIGMVLSPIVAGVLMDTMGLDAVFYLSGLFTLLGILALIGVTPEA